ncbi:MAG: ComF family protein [Pseudooceanicola sp.]
MKFQTALHLIYPPRCLTCGGMVDSDFGLCGPCWRDTPFISGMVCDLCGTPLIGGKPGEVAHCDDCMAVDRPWRQGRSAMVYGDNARRIVLALKHGDRQDLAAPAGHWMARALAGIDAETMLIAPIPLHRLRLLKRRFNQSACLSRTLSRILNADHCPDLLTRTKRTTSLDGLGADARFDMLSGAISVSPSRQPLIVSRHVLLVDDVMTSGATLAAATRACLIGGANGVSVVTLARVAKAA